MHQGRGSASLDLMRRCPPIKNGDIMRDRTKRGRRWPELAIAYFNRDCTQAEFCKRHGVKPSTLSYHVKKTAAKPKFLPALRVEEPSTEILLELPAGIKLTIRR